MIRFERLDEDCCLLKKKDYTKMQGSLAVEKRESRVYQLKHSWYIGLGNPWDHVEASTSRAPASHCLTRWGLGLAHGTLRTRAYPGRAKVNLQVAEEPSPGEPRDHVWSTPCGLELRLNNQLMSAEGQEVDRRGQSRWGTAESRLDPGKTV